MRAHITPTGDFAEFGKTDTVVVTLIINGTEARRILEDIGFAGTSEASCRLLEIMAAIENGGVEVGIYNDEHSA